MKLDLLNKFELIQNNIRLFQISSYYESLSWPDPNKPKFLNIVLKVGSFLEPSKLLKKCKEIEKEWLHPLLKTNIKDLILSLSNKEIRSIKQI